MELKTEKLSVKLDGVVHELSYPSVKQIKELDKKKDDLDVDVVCELVHNCGMPKDVVDGMQANHLNQIVEALLGKMNKS